MRKSIMTLLVASILQACNSYSNPRQDRKAIQISPLRKPVPTISGTILNGFVRITMDSHGFVNIMAYATVNNFTKQQIYPCASCYLRPAVAKALLHADTLAKNLKLQLVIYDCYRPFSLQKKMYDIVRNPDFVALPSKGSMHNRGAAVDIGLADSEGRILEMGSAFDDFSEKAHYYYNGLNRQSATNRKLLRNLMLQSHFVPYEKEWWHFSYVSENYPTSDLQWNCN